MMITQQIFITHQLTKPIDISKRINALQCTADILLKFKLKYISINIDTAMHIVNNLMSSLDANVDTMRFLRIMGFQFRMQFNHRLKDKIVLKWFVYLTRFIQRYKGLGNYSPLIM